MIASFTCCFNKAVPTVRAYINKFECGGGVQMIDAGLHTLRRSRPCIHIHVDMGRGTTYEKHGKKGHMSRPGHSWHSVVWKTPYMEEQKKKGGRVATSRAQFNQAYATPLPSVEGGYQWLLIDDQVRQVIAESLEKKKLNTCDTTLILLSV